VRLAPRGDGSQQRKAVDVLGCSGHEQTLSPVKSDWRAPMSVSREER